jgi:hypothetical protein
MVNWLIRNATIAQIGVFRPKSNKHPTATTTIVTGLIGLRLHMATSTRMAKAMA